MPPGNKMAIQALLVIHGSCEKYFLAPTRSKSGNPVTAANLAKSFAGLYTPGYQHNLPTLNRKFYHSETDEAEHETPAFNALCQSDKHSSRTGKKTYVCPNPAKDARVGLAFFKHLFGEPVNWPTAEELADGRDKSIARIKSVFCKNFGGKGGTGGDDGGDGELAGGDEADGEDVAGNGGDDADGDDDEADPDCDGDTLGDSGVSAEQAPDSFTSSAMDETIGQLTPDGKNERLQSDVECSAPAVEQQPTPCPMVASGPELSAAQKMDAVRERVLSRQCAPAETWPRSLVMPGELLAAPRDQPAAEPATRLPAPPAAAELATSAPAATDAAEPRVWDTVENAGDGQRTLHDVGHSGGHVKVTPNPPFVVQPEKPFGDLARPITGGSSVVTSSVQAVAAHRRFLDDKTTAATTGLKPKCDNVTGFSKVFGGDSGAASSTGHKPAAKGRVAGSGGTEIQPAANSSNEPSPASKLLRAAGSGSERRAATRQHRDDEEDDLNAEFQPKYSLTSSDKVWLISRAIRGSQNNVIVPNLDYARKLKDEGLKLQKLDCRVKPKRILSYYRRVAESGDDELKRRSSEITPPAKSKLTTTRQLYKAADKQAVAAANQEYDAERRKLAGKKE